MTELKTACLLKQWIQIDNKLKLYTPVTTFEVLWVTSGVVLRIISSFSSGVIGKADAVIWKLTIHLLLLMATDDTCHLKLLENGWNCWILQLHSLAGYL